LKHYKFLPYGEIFIQKANDELIVSPSKLIAQEKFEVKKNIIILIISLPLQSSIAANFAQLSFQNLEANALGSLTFNQLNLFTMESLEIQPTNLL